MISDRQICAGRAFLAWSAEDLAKAAKVGVATVRRIETTRDANRVPTGQRAILEAIQRALEEGGVEFTGEPGNNPGVAYVGPRERVWSKMLEKN